MKLIFKIFFVNLVVCFILIFLMAAVMRFYTLRHFREDTARVRSENLTELSYELALDIQANGMQRLYDHPGQVLFELSRRMRPRPPGPDFDDHRQGHSGPAPPLVLFDAEKKQIAGPKTVPGDLMLKPIIVAKKTIGWLGTMHRPFPAPSPPALSERLKALYAMSIIIFVLAGAVSYFLSRHILSPIDKVTEGTMQLARFEFGTRIKVRSKDELGRLAADFNQMAATLQNYENLQKQWVVDISHELRTPVSILKGEIEAIRDGVHRPDGSRISSLHEEVVHMEKIIEDLYLLSTADSENLSMHSDTIEPVQVLKSVLALFETPLKNARLGLKCRFETEGQHVLGDKDRLKQLFLNIMDNHLKYTTRPGDIIIHSRVKGPVLAISFEDTGPGVPPESIGKLFDRMYRVDKSRSRKTGGTGLGLSICRAIAEAHNGRIYAQNIPDSGLKIMLELPVI